MDSLASLSKRPFSAESLAKTKMGFQQSADDQICCHHEHNPEIRIRGKQIPWRLHKQENLPHVVLAGKRATPAWQASHTLHRLRLLATLVPPRVWAAVFGTIFNGWTTARRFQQRWTKRNICVLGCSPTAEGSLEHYARCPCTIELARRHLRLDPDRDVNLHRFNLFNPHMTTQEDLVATAFLVYAVYRATNYMRNNAGQGSC